MAAATIPQRLRRWGMNALVALVLALMLLETTPGVPQWLSWRPHMLAEGLGLWQFTWSMFTPEPDNENHRLHATIEYYDGHTAQWRSPEYRAESWWQRFVGHRRSEYIDEIHSPWYGPAHPGFARWLTDLHRQDASEAGRPKHIEIYVETTDIPDPRIRGWKPHRPAKFEHETLLFMEDYP